MNNSRRISPIHITRVGSAQRVSSALRIACAPFCVLPTPQRVHEPPTPTIDASTIEQIRRSRVVQIVGPSGAGKSTLMRGLACALPAYRVRLVPESLSPAQRRRAAFDLLSGDGSARAASLAHAGLGEPRIWARPAGMLSGGEQARLRLAMGMHRATLGDVVIADEFASNLDRVCAYALSSTISRWARRLGVTLIAGSAHEDLQAMLAPDLVLDASTALARAPCPPQTQPITFEPGTRHDYQRLAHLHYRSGAPATIVLVLRGIRHVPCTIDPSGRLLAGVLVVSMPTLNAVWRQRAWPGHFNTPDKSLNARRLNQQVRLISRVIVEPRSRGLGVGSGLVRAYLENPLTPATEASACMGSVCPFFQRAGMTPYEIVHDLIDTRLLDALTHLAISPQSLAHRRIEARSLLTRELITWGKARKLLPKGKPSTQQVQRLTPIAACRLCSRPRAYAYVKGEHDDAQPDKQDSARAGA